MSLSDTLENISILNLHNSTYSLNNFKRLYNIDTKKSDERISALALFYIKECPTRKMSILYDRFKRSKKDIKFIIEKQMHNLYLQNIDIYTKSESVEERKRCGICVYQYYKDNCEDDILLDEAFELEQLVYKDSDNIDYKKWINLITAATQSGKTFLLIALFMIFTSLGYNSIFIVKDVSQVTQFLSRVVPECINIQKMLKNKHFSKKIIDCFNPPLYCDSSNTKEENIKFIKSIKSSMERTSNRSILCIHNNKQIQNIVYNIEHNSKFVLFVDEAHKLGAYKEIGDKTEYTIDEDKKEDSYDKLYISLKTHSRKIFLFTATPQNILLCEPELYTSGVVLKNNSKEYRGIDTWKFNIIPDKREDVEVSCGNSIILIPKCFLDCMNELSDIDPINRINKFGIVDRLPIGLIAKIEVVNDKQLDLFNCFKNHIQSKNKIQQKIIDKSWVLIVFNMVGIRFYSRCMIGLVMNIMGDKYIEVMKDTGEFLLPRSKVKIEDILHWLGNNGGYKRFSHYVIFTYRSAEEGITFSSTWGDTPGTCHNIHPTYEYARLGKSSSTSNTEQSLGRVNGNHGDYMLDGTPIIPTVFCTQGCKEKSLKGYNMQKTQITDLIDMKSTHKDCRVIDFIRTYTFFSNRVPKNYYGRIKGGMQTILKIDNPDTDAEEQSFKTYNNAIISLQMINPDFYNSSKFRDRECSEMIKTLSVKNKTSTNNEEDVYNYIYSMLSTPKKSKIYKFVNSISVDTLYSKPTLLNLLTEAGYDQPTNILNSFISTRNHRKIKYGSRYSMFCLDRNKNMWCPREGFLRAIKENKS